MRNAILFALLWLCLLATSCRQEMVEKSNANPSDEVSVSDEFAVPVFGDVYSRQGVTNCGVCLSPGPTDHLNIRFVWGEPTKPVRDSCRPAISDGKVFFVGEVYVTPVSEFLYSIDCYTGEELWQYRLTHLKGRRRRFWHHVIPLGQGILIQHTLGAGTEGNYDEDYLTYVDKKTGRLIWNKSIPYSNRTPVIYEGKVYVGRLDLHCLDYETGNELWTAKIPEWGVGGIACQDGIVILAEKPGVIRALDAKTGRRIWKYKNSALGLISYNPVISNDVVFVTGGDNNKDVAVALDFKTGKQLWKINGNVGGRMAAKDGKIYFAVGNKLYCKRIQTGKDIWEYSSFHDVYGYLTVSSDGIIYFNDTHGVIYAVDCKDGKEVFKIRVVSNVIEHITKEARSEGASTSPIMIYDHAIYFRYGTKIRCIEDRRFNPLVIETAARYSQILASQKADEAQVSVLVAQMGGGQYAAREAAREELLKMGLTAYPGLKEGAKNSDAEISSACLALLGDMKAEIETFEFLEKEGFGESVEYFLTVLKTCRPIFVAQCVEALARITGREFKGDLADIEAARAAALTQYAKQVLPKASDK